MRSVGGGGGEGEGGGGGALAYLGQHGQRAPHHVVRRVREAAHHAHEHAVRLHVHLCSKAKRADLHVIYTPFTRVRFSYALG